MNQEIKKEWVAALRSGEYKQAKGQLKKDSGFCCLGVLCDIASKHGVGKWGKEAYESDDDGYWWGASVLPEEVAKFAGLDNRDPGVTIHGKKDILSNHNDEGRRFKTIAKAIEEQL